ncbi:hypothetical protein FRC02_006793 [Tulasnella sp. 418]|nr:hypothetical protein FRC02_006793 [Tulasnella sp. 418]
MRQGVTSWADRRFWEDEMLSLDTRKRMCCQGTLIDDQFQPECFPLGTRFDFDQVYCCASSAPTRPIEILPFQLQSLISDAPFHGNASAATRHRSTGSNDFFGTGVSPLDLFSWVTNATPRPSRPSRDAQQTPSTQQEIVCAQALNKDIFVGCSDGTLMRYTTKEDNYSGDPYHIVSQQVVPGGKPIDRIALVPFLCKMRNVLLSYLAFVRRIATYSNKSAARSFDILFGRKCAPCPSELTYDIH